MLTNQPTCLRSQFKHTQARRIIQINRSIIQLSDTAVQLSPFIRSKLTATNLVTSNLADIHHQTVHQLHITHLKRKHSTRYLAIHSHLSHHRDDKRRLTHSRTRSNDNQVRSLPAIRNFVQFLKARRQSRQSIIPGRSTLQLVIRLLDNRIYLRIVLLQISLA